MDKFTVVCGIANHNIYVMNMNDLNQGTQCVTNAAITAVRDYMVDDIKQGEHAVGYSWNRGDGKVVKLICSIEDGE